MHPSPFPKVYTLICACNGAFSRRAVLSDRWRSFLFQKCLSLFIRYLRRDGFMFSFPSTRKTWISSSGKPFYMDGVFKSGFLEEGDNAQARPPPSFFLALAERVANASPSDLFLLRMDKERNFSLLLFSNSPHAMRHAPHYFFPSREELAHDPIPS